MKIHFSLSVIVLLFFTFLSSSFLLEKKPKHPFGKKFKVPKSYTYIPSGKLMMGKTTKISVFPFFMSKTEISNLEYNEFLADLKKQNKTEDYELAKQHPERWREKSVSFGEPFIETYHNHPAYEDYPVLTISKKGAELYCKWLTEKLQPKYPKHNINFRLPTEHEWVYAARGGHQLAPYPWGGYYIRNSKGKFLANFKNIGGESIRYDRKNDKYEVVIGNRNSMSMPSPTDSFIPNDFGLYNMVGNAAEMVSTRSAKNKGNRTKGGCYDSTAFHITIDSEDEFDGWTEPSPFIGFRTIMDVSLK
ncbi:MAG: formylglycine-generating enzyme family protein [Saprospiraceae bacterium]